VQQRS